MDVLAGILKGVSEAKDWVTLLAAISFMIIFWEPIAERLGWKKAVPAREFAGMEDIVREVQADTRNAMQPLLMEMQQLRQYANHETTEHLEKLEDSFQQFRSTQLQQCSKLDLVVDVLQDISRNGIRIRK